MPATTTKLAIPYPVASDKAADYPTTAKQAAETIETAIAARPPISTLDYTGTSTTANYQNLSIPLGQTYATPPIVWAQNISTNTMHLIRILEVTTTSVSVQVQTANGAGLGIPKIRLILAGA